MDLLSYLHLFYDIDEASCSLLVGELKPRLASKGEMLVVPGQVQRDLYFVKRGVQMCYQDGASGMQVVAFTNSPGICAVPGSFLSQRPSAHYMACLTESEFDCLSFEALQLLCKQSQDIERLFKKMTETVLSGIIERHIELRAMSSEARYRAFCKLSPHLLQTVRHKHLASYLGLGAVDFSRLYHEVKAGS